jgi:hypothetical protein
MTSEAPRKTGKWLRDGVPHSGWKCTEVVEGGPLCDMCEVTHIVYAHVMTHPQYPGWLECGYVCAGFMTDSPAVELVRELLYKWRQSQDKTPIEAIRRKGWHRTSYTDESHEFGYSPTRYYNASRHLDFRVKIANSGRWHYRLFRDWRTVLLSSEQPYPSVEAAALAGIEHAELLMVDPIWQAADCEAEAERLAANAAAQAATDLKDALCYARENGREDIAAALEAG